MSTRKAWLATATGLAIGLSSCGTQQHRTVTAVVGGAPVKVTASAPAYCRTLTSSKALVGLGGTLSRLATDPTSSSARASIRQAAGSVKAAAAQADGPQAAALVQVEQALNEMAANGLAVAPDLNKALHTAGAAMRGSCGFPLG